MEKRKVVLNVAGYTFNITTDLTDKEIQLMTQRVDLRIKSFQRQSAKLGKEACAVLTALDLCDDVFKAEAKSHELKQKADDIAVDNKLLREENEKAIEKIKSLEKQTEALKRELERYLVTTYENKKTQQEQKDSTESQPPKNLTYKNKHNKKNRAKEPNQNAKLSENTASEAPKADNGNTALEGQISLFED